MTISKPLIKRAKQAIISSGIVNHNLRKGAQLLLRRLARGALVKREAVHAALDSTFSTDIQGGRDGDDLISQPERVGKCRCHRYLDDNELGIGSRYGAAERRKQTQRQLLDENRMNERV